MKRITSVSLPVAALVVALSAGDVRAQSNPWSVSFDLGTQVSLNGDVHGGGSGTVLGLPTQVEARSYGDIYGGFYCAAGLGYRLGEAGSVVPSAGAGGGVQINLSDRVAVQGGVEFKWQGDAKDLDGLAGTGLESINDESRRWSMPITGGIIVRF